VIVVDARSGRQMQPGQAVTYPDGDYLILRSFKRTGLFSAVAEIEHYDPGIAAHRPNTFHGSVPLVVRFLHPAYLFRWVGFIPS